MNFYVTLFLFTYIYLTDSAKDLPSFIKVCHRSDPNLNKCVLEHAREAIPHIIQGVKEFDIPKLSPFKVSKVEFDTGENLKLQITNLTIKGLETCELVHGGYDIKTMIISLDMFFKKIEIHGTYEINGRILVLPIQGKGPLDLTLDDLWCNATLLTHWLDKDGVKYNTVTSEEIILQEKNAKITMKDLFNGDKALGDQMNKFLNENWSDVRKELIPAITKVTETIALKIVNTFSTQVPVDVIYPE